MESVGRHKEAVTEVYSVPTVLRTSDHGALRSRARRRPSSPGLRAFLPPWNGAEVAVRYRLRLSDRPGVTPTEP